MKNLKHLWTLELFILLIILHGLCHVSSVFVDCHYHYANMSVQYTAVFQGCTNSNFQMKKKEKKKKKKSDIFLIFAQNIDRGYTLEPPH